MWGHSSRCLSSSPATRFRIKTFVHIGYISTQNRFRTYLPFYFQETRFNDSVSNLIFMGKHVLSSFCLLNGHMAVIKNHLFKGCCPGNSLGPKFWLLEWWWLFSFFFTLFCGDGTWTHILSLVKLALSSLELYPQPHCYFSCSIQSYFRLSDQDLINIHFKQSLASPDSCFCIIEASFAHPRKHDPVCFHSRIW